MGYHEAPGYREQLGLAELADFLEVIRSTASTNAPRAWLERKIATYHANGAWPRISTYIYGSWPPATTARSSRRSPWAGELGVQCIEFMNTGSDVTPRRALKPD